MNENNQNATSYQGEKKHYVAIDCIIFGFDGQKLKLLLIKRNFEPEKDKWSLMGGFVKENENLREGSERILNELTGLENVYLEQLFTYGEAQRDPVARTLSISYFALINIEDHDAGLTKSKNGEWFTFDEKPPLIFDHDKMVNKALAHLQYKAALHPLGFELLPEKFTIPQLQKLYEAIYDKELDRRNFSRKILSTGLLIDTGEKYEGGNTKKAMLYTLDKEKYGSQFNDFHYFTPKGFF
ncbi:NUDIX hydrolase [Jiulongibacter sp. NS-SX5]|uniref:NUDIX hydrolase n=1 Tax=Jiulongibacter sp. NS-SX5 TaxID=3463854 RepID=UPI004058BAED